MAVRTPPEKTAVRRGRPDEALQAEILADAVAGGPIAVELVVGTIVRVLPARMWRISALTALKAGDFDTWAKKALASTGDYDTFMAVDPTLADIEAFMTRFGELSDPGN